MRERTVEKYLCDQVRNLNGITYKLVSPGTNGVPDRIVILYGQIWFIELKAPGKKARELQKYHLNKLSIRGCNVAVLDNQKSVDRLLNIIENYQNPSEITDEESRRWLESWGEKPGVLHDEI